jgi:hypothetical protein
VEQAISRKAAVRLLRPMANGAEGRFNGIRRPKTRPMGSGKGVEGQPRFPIFLQKRRRFRILWLIGFQKEIQCVFRRRLGRSSPDILQRLFGFGLHTLR